MILQENHNHRDNSIHIGVSEEKHLKYPFHFHLDHYELTYIEGGSGILLAGDKVFEFTGNDILLIPPRIPHAWISYKSRELNGHNAYKVITIHFTLNYLTEGLLLRPEMANLRRLLVAAEQVAIIKKITDTEIIQNLFALKLESDFHTYIQILQLLDRLGSHRELGTLLNKKYRYRGNIKDQAKFALIFENILNNYTRRIKISVPAGIAGLNDTAFSHYFKKRTGNSFTDYINLLRLTEADALIKTSGKKIARICIECGFHNLSNFNRIYKSWQKVTPAERRRSVKTHD